MSIKPFSFKKNFLKVTTLTALTISLIAAILLTFVLVGLPKSPFSIIAAAKKKSVSQVSFLVPTDLLSENLEVDPCGEKSLESLYDSPANFNVAKSGLNVFKARLVKEYSAGSSSFNNLASKILSKSFAPNEQSKTCLLPLKIRVDQSLRQDLASADFSEIGLGEQSILCSKGQALFVDESDVYPVKSCLDNYSKYIKDKNLVIVLKKQIANLQLKRAKLGASKKIEKAKLDKDIRKLSLSSAYAKYFAKDAILLGDFFDAVCKKAATIATPVTESKLPTRVPATLTSIPSTVVPPTSVPVTIPPTFAPSIVPPQCTSVPCSAPGVLVCNQPSCAGGCGLVCRVPTITNTPSIAPTSGGGVTGFKDGDRIILSNSATELINVRSRAVIAADSLIGQQPKTSVGTIKKPSNQTAYPVQTNDQYGVITWWYVDFDNSDIDGWCGENNFQHYRDIVTPNPVVTATPTFTGTVTTGFKVNDAISLKTASTKIRSEPRIADETLKGIQLQTATGTIIQPPNYPAGSPYPVQTNDQYGTITWWYVNFDNGIDGWSGENNYELLIPCTNGQTETRTAYAKPEVAEGEVCQSEQQIRTCGADGKFSAWSGAAGYLYNSCYQPPTTENLCKTGSSDAISQYGITWQFDTKYPCGLFANGDYWVAPIAGHNNNKVKIIRITPDFAQGNNGWEVNPNPCDGSLYCGVARQAYTSKSWGIVYDPNLMPTLPYDAAGGSSIVKAIGHSTPPNCKRKVWNGEIDGYLSLGNICEDGAPISTVAVLTVTNDIVPNGTFRPPYSGNWKPLFTYAEVNENRLLKLDPPAGAIVSIADLERKIEKLQMDDGGLSWLYTQVMPVRNLVGGYGANLVGLYAEVVLRLQLNDSIEAKRGLLKKMIQTGIDYYGLYKSGKNWPPDGGHYAKAKLPIIFAGYMLGNAEMLNIKKINPSVWLFQEDCNWFYTQDNPAYPEQPKNCYPAISEQFRTPGKGFARFGSRACQGYRGTAYDADYYGENMSCISGAPNTYWGENVASQRGNAIAIELLGLKSQWANDAFFDHMNWTWKSGITGNGVYQVALNNAMYAKYHK